LVTKGLENFNKSALKESNISYDQDIKPWIGGVMIAMLPPNAAKPAQFNTPGTATPGATPSIPIAKTSEPNVLMIIGIKDKIAALNFATKLKGQKNVKSQEIDYKGEKITETKADKGQPTYSAVLNNTHIAFSPQKQAVEHAIDTFKGAPSFASKEGSSNLFSKGLELKNTLAQVYVPDYGAMVQQLLASNPQATQLPPQTLAQLKQVKGMVMGVGVDDAGIRMKAIASLDPQLVKYQYQPSAAKIISQFPADTLALVSGQGISRAWTAFVDQSKDYPELKQGLEQSRTQLKTVNLDLDKEILGWMDGEFGFAAIPSNQGILANVGVGGAFVFDTSDRKTAEATFTKLDNLAKQQQIAVAPKDIGGKQVTEWQVPKQGALLTHGWLDQDTVFIAIGGPIAEAIASPKGQNLESSESFKAVAGSLQKPNAGYFYLDMDKTMTLVNRFVGKTQAITPEANAILSSIRGLGVTAVSSDKTNSQVEMLLALKPKTAK
jgi:Protein of unknown function (DUF3352)